MIGDGTLVFFLGGGSYRVLVGSGLSPPLFFLMCVFLAIFCSYSHDERECGGKGGRGEGGRRFRFVVGDWDRGELAMQLQTETRIEKENGERVSRKYPCLGASILSIMSPLSCPALSTLPYPASLYVSSRCMSCVVVFGSVRFGWDGMGSV